MNETYTLVEKLSAPEWLELVALRAPDSVQKCFVSQIR